MPKSLKLLLTENVDSLGIVGDVVNVRTGYARNFLLPRSLASRRLLGAAFKEQRLRVQFGEKGRHAE